MYIIILLFLGFVLALVVYYFSKALISSDLDYHTTSVKLSESVGEQKRKHPRANINWRVSMETSEGTIVAEVRNISLGGAFICCNKPLPVGEVFHLTMMGPDNEPLAATAEVVWSNVHIPDEKVINRGMGVRFIKMSARHIQLVQQLLK